MANRSPYQHQQYLKRKFPGLTSEQIKTAQLKEDQLRTQRAIKRHKFWLNRYIKAQPGLFTVFSDMAFAQRELICDKIRRDAARLLKESEMGLFVENSYIYSRRGKKQKC